MADPLSIIAASVGLAETLYRIGSYIHGVIASAAKIEEDILSLSHEIQALILVNESVSEAFREESALPSGTSAADSARVENLWRNVATLLKNCQATVEELEGVLTGIVGSGTSSKVAGKIDNLKKAIRMERKEDEIKGIRLKLTNYHTILQILLTAINLAYTRSSQGSTDKSLGYLSQEVQVIGFKLRSQIDILRQRLPSAGGSHFHDAVTSATAVASLVPTNKHFYLPQTVSSIFTGRASFLEDLQGYFGVSGASTPPSSIQRRFIVFGLGGSGKTQFCCKFAQNNRQNFWGIFCIDATSPETAEHSFSKIAKIGKIEASEGSYRLAARYWLSSLELPWLLLIDNADDSYPLENYFPDGERGCILVTTRDPGKKFHGTVGPRFYHFEKMETNEANDLLLKAACQPRPWDPPTVKSADLIADTLGFLPLALVQAGMAIMNGLCSLTNYIEHYHKSWERIRHARKHSGYRGDENKNMNVYSSYEINLRSLEDSNEEEDNDAVQLLKMFSFFGRENIRVDFLIAAARNPQVEREHGEKSAEDQERLKMVSRPKTWSEFVKEIAMAILEFTLRDRGPPVLPSVLREAEPLSSFNELLELRVRHALNVLSRKSLITYHETADNYSMHPLVHTWVRERPEMTLGEQALWCQAAITTLTQAILLPPHGSSKEEEEMRRNLLPHINHVRKCQVRISTRIHDNQRARKPAWMPVPREKFGRQQAKEWAKFSRVYSECGLWKEAEALQLAVKNFVCSMLGPEHPASRGIMLFLSATYWHQARINEAAELQSQVYQSCLKSFGPNHPQTLKVMDTLGSSRCFQGRFKESLELHEKAIEGMKKTPPLNKEDIYIAMCNLGRIKWRYFRYEEAKDLHTKALEGLKSVLGPTHPQTLIAMEDLAMSYMDCGKELLEPAHELMLEVLEQRKRSLGTEQPFTLLATSNLARVKSALGKAAEAEALFRDAIPIAERILGENHFGTLAGKVHFAQALVRQARYDEAEAVFTAVIEKQHYASAARSDGDHPDRIMALWCLTLCYELHSKIADALHVVAELEYVVNTIGGHGLGKLHPFAERLQAKKIVLEAAASANATTAEAGGQPDLTI